MSEKDYQKEYCCEDCEIITVKKRFLCCKNCKAVVGVAR